MPVMWAINTTFHTTLKASQAQLAFNCDLILPIPLPIGMPSTTTNKPNLKPPTMPKTANAFRTNFASMTKSSSVVTLEIIIWGNWPNLHKALSKLSMYNNYQTMVLFLSSDSQLLLSASTFANCCHFLNITIEDANVVPQSL
jgi:hypothetical protein